MQNSSMSMDSGSRCNVNQAFELLETEGNLFQGKNWEEAENSFLILQVAHNLR